MTLILQHTFEHNESSATFSPSFAAARNETIGQPPDCSPISSAGGNLEAVTSLPGKGVLD